MTYMPDSVNFNFNLNAINAELGQRSLLEFTRLTFPGYEVNWHHRLICEKLQLFAEGKIKRLAIFMPPQTGKSELSSRRLPAYILGKDPDRRIAICSYNSDKASEFNRHVQRIMLAPEYRNIFPETRLNDRHVNTDSDGSYLRNSTDFEIVGHRGYLTVAGIGSALTGKTVDLLIADDLVKDMIEAKSPTTQKRNIDWWDSVAMTRLHNDSQVLLLMTRWDNNDIPGKLIKRMREGKCEHYEIIKLPSLKTNEITEGDPRKKGEALWENKHSKKSLLMKKKANPANFKAMHQQDPGVADEYRIFSDWKEIRKMPVHDSFYGVDWGYTNNPSAAVECQFYKGKGYIRELFYEPGLEYEDIARKLIASGIKRERIFCDGAEPRGTNKLRKMGLNAVNGLHCKNSVNIQITYVKKHIKMHYIKSLNLEHEYTNYQWQPGPDGPVNLEIDKNNHLMKAILYAFYGHLNGKKIWMGFA